MESAGLIAFQLVIMLVLILFGWFLLKKGHLTDEGNRQLSHLVIAFVNPVMIFVAFQTDYDSQLLANLGWAALISFAAHVVSIIYATLFFRKGERGQALERFASVYANCAFIGIPLVSSVYGTDGVLYITMSIMMFNFFMWTHGVLTLEQKFDAKGLLATLKAPTLIATVLGLICFLLRIRMPELVLQPMRYIYNLNTPLAMIVAGATMAQTQMRAALRKPGIYRVAGVRLLLAPLTLLLMFGFLPFVPLDVLTTGVIAAGCPTATATIMMAHRHHQDAAYAAELFVLVTLMSMVTLPLVVFLTSVIRG